MKQVFSKFKLQVIKETEYEYNCNSVQRIGSPSDLAYVCLNVLDLAREPEEVFGMFTLDTKNNLTGYFEISKGSLNSSIVHPREAYKRALLQNASSVVFVHNHPSGEPEPSHEDIVLTNRLDESGKILGIRLLDHIIVGNEFSNAFYSFKKECLL